MHTAHGKRSLSGRVENYSVSQSSVSLWCLAVSVDIFVSLRMIEQIGDGVHGEHGGAFEDDDHPDHLSGVLFIASGTDANVYFPDKQLP